ncbi:NADH dehydrogenase [Rhodoligotrophos appendicifer]|uniref:NAD(P)/FAD-dependent oxidoreductase n=1 Tax=Rhodoligotrophos appendicifer TaxID=987056 RepID=UPI00196126DA|nr:NAD(P)/FAD-dependent oxidoreductase [Rhodoligotrophos appendicifer]
MRRPKVLIIGAGFGGLEVARGLSRSEAELTILDRENHHCFQPLLYQVATAALSPADIAWPIRGLLGKAANTTVLMTEATRIDAENGRVFAGKREFPYDFLVLATGVTHSYFGNDHWANWAPGLKHIEDATEIRRRLLTSFELAEITSCDDERRRLTTFVVIGGGPTGVEMAGAISELARHALPRDFRHVDPEKSRIILIEAGPRILSGYPEDLSRYAQNSLEKMGVEIITGAPVSDCNEAGVSIGSRHIGAGAVVWAAGVRASSLAGTMGAKCDKSGRVKVESDLSVPGYPNVFAIGDVAAVQQDGKPVPGIAPAAKQMGQHVTAVIKRRLAGDDRRQSFHYRHQGDLATIGRKAAVVKLKNIELRGFIGWIFWGVVHVYFLMGGRNRAVVGLNWLWNYMTFQRSARLITMEPTPRETKTDQEVA